MNVKEQLKETSQQLQSLIASVPGGIGIFELKNQNLGYRYFNEGLAGILGYTYEEYAEVITHTAVAVVYPEDLPVLMHTVAETVSNPHPNDSTTSEFRMIKKDGSLVWIFLSASIMSIEQDCIVFSAVFTDITDLKIAQTRIEEKNQALRYHSEHDHLTGLYNREKFCAMAEAFLKSHAKEECAVIRFDIERFKMINELFGAETGDRVLCCIADMLREEVGDKGIYGRLEADHFSVCIRKADMEVEKILKAHQVCFQSLNLDYNINICAGVFLTSEAQLSVDYLSVEQMCERANMALATVKGKPFQHYAIYHENMRSNLVREQFITNEMQHALDDGQFVFYLQPIYDAVSEAPVSAEALVRWVHPTKGMISPGTFIPLFERNGFIAKLDSYIWEHVCQYLAEAVAQKEPVVPVSVNVSRVDLFALDLCEKIIKMVDGYGISHDLIKFEITESAYVDDSRQLQEVIQMLQQNGFKVLMDDFGSGYSSLNMLKDMPFDILKIDMRFLEDFSVYNRSGNVLNSVVRMAKLLNMNVVAEGVETRDQLSFLRSSGCDWIQGYYFSKPLPLNEYRHFLRNLREQSQWETEAQQGKNESIVADERGAGQKRVEAVMLDFTWESMQRELERQRHYFDVVRIVNPVKTSVCGEHGSECNEHACHAVWKKDTRCSNCISMRAFENHTRVNKLEHSDNDLFFVIAQWIRVEGQNLVMELVSHIEEGYIDSLMERDLLITKLDDLQQQLVIDELTGVFNRRYIERHLKYLVEHGSGRKQDLGIAMVDVDFLKAINDSCGHQAGDSAIRQIATLLQANIARSKGDFVARYGGDEFMVVCRNITPETFCKRLRTVSEHIHQATLEDHPSIHLGVSIGAVNTSEYEGESLKQLIDHADKRLYMAKLRGRGEVIGKLSDS